MELDREALMQMIDARVAAGIKEWFQAYMLPLHNDNKVELRGMQAELKELCDTFNRAKGAWWAVGLLGSGLIIIVNHFWK